jgi:hypothetical protein
VDEVDISNRLTLFPTIVMATSDDHAAINTFYIYLDKVRVCACMSFVQAVCILYMFYYVFNIAFPKDMLNTFNFVDVYVAKIGKNPIRKAVQRRLNFLM